MKMEILYFGYAALPGLLFLGIFCSGLPRVRRFCLMACAAGLFIPLLAFFLFPVFVAPPPLQSFGSLAGDLLANVGRGLGYEMERSVYSMASGLVALLGTLIYALRGGEPGCAKR